MINFLVQGSASEPYQTVFDKKDDKLTAKCSCPAGAMGQYCKHRFRILGGNTDGIVSTNIQDVKIVQGWLAGSDIEMAIHNLAEGEAELERAKKKVAAAKKALARVMSK
jgi:peroxiredoxin